MRILDPSEGPACRSWVDLADNCGLEGLMENSGNGVEALVDAELLLEAGRERSEDVSAAVLVLASTVMRDEVAEGRTDAEVHDLVSRAVGLPELVLRGVDDEPTALSFAAASRSEIDGVGA